MQDKVVIRLHSLRTQLKAIQGQERETTPAYSLRLAEIKKGVAGVNA